MARFRRGEAVVYNGEVFWITEGPTHTADGPVYQISAVPPPKRARESELSSCPAGYEEAAIESIRGFGVRLPVDSADSS